MFKISARLRGLKEIVLKSTNLLYVWILRTIINWKMSGSTETANISSLGKGDTLHQQGKKTSGLHIY